MYGREQIMALVPHGGAMCLWDEVVDWQADRIALRAGNHRDVDHPLRAGGQLAAVHLCEYGAQAMAVHGGLLASGSGQAPAPGMLVALREVQLNVARIDDLDDMLEGRAELLASGGGSQQYRFEIHHRGQLLASGRAAVMLQLPTP